MNDRRTRPRTSLKHRLNLLVLIGVFMLVGVAVAVPFYSSASSSTGSGRISTPGSAPNTSRFASSIASNPTGLGAPLTSFLPIPQSSPEEIATFASDCTTPKTTFILGETVCAKTVFVTETDRWVNWIDPNSNVAHGGPTTTPITTNQAQDFLYTPTMVGNWNATIADASNPAIVSAPFTVEPPPPIATYAHPGCVVPKTDFNLGETVCAKASGIPVSTFPWRITWVDPAGFVREADLASSDNSTEYTYTLPTDPTSEINGQTVDNRGTWRANVVRPNGSVRSTASFVVHEPANPQADVLVQKVQRDSADSIHVGDNAAFVIVVQNAGPDPAAGVHLVDSAPAGSTLVSFNQDSGPPCTGETPGDCTMVALPNGERAEFTVIYTIGGSPGPSQTSASVSSTTPDPNTGNNSSTAAFVVVTGSGGGQCELTCPSDITTFATHSENGQRGANVNYDPAVGTGPCGTITSTPASGSFFPVGTTTVTATSETGGGECHFTVTVEEGGSVGIICPADQEGNANANCEASFNLGTPTTTGDHVTLFATRSDGEPMYDCDANGNCTRRSPDAPFAAGTTTITWTAYSHDVAGPYTTPGPNPGETFEEQHRTGSASCTQTVTVNDVTPPVIAATDQTIAADANCQAVVPDYISTVSDNCACASSDTSEACEDNTDFTYTQTPAAGTVVGPGEHEVVITANDGSSNNEGAGNETTKTITLTVADQTPPVIDCPDNISTTTDPGVCSAVVDPGTATATDNCDTSPTITGTRSDSQALNAPYPTGTTTITWRATDDAGNYSECTQTVTVADDEAPVITFNGVTPSMWPPNHNYRTFTNADFISSVSDNCNSLSVNDVYITKVTSDEAEESLTLGDGTTFNDMVIAADCKSVQLRAERVNSGNGRVYTIHFKLVDSSGNVTTGTAKVHAPKNQNNGTVDDGPMYTVTSSCP